MSPATREAAYVETTVLTDLLLKTGSLRQQAKEALECFDQKLLPVYAIKEFKNGPLRRFVWLHNKLVLLGSFAAVFDSLQRVSRTPQRYLTSTALEALKTTAYAIKDKKLGELVNKYGRQADLDLVQRDEYRYALRTAIEKAWKLRRKYFQVIQPLCGYVEVAPFLKRGLLSLEPTSCKKSESCCIGPELLSHSQELNGLREATDLISNAEHKRRSQVLSDMIRKPKLPVAQKQCRNLGDAIFALFVPVSATILTTNIRDLRPLAEAVGKKCKSPSEIIAEKEGVAACDESR